MPNAALSLRLSVVVAFFVFVCALSAPKTKAQQTSAVPKATLQSDLEIATTSFNEGRWSDASDAFKRIARRDMKNAAAAYNAAVCIERAGSLREAAEWYAEALARDPHYRGREKIIAAHIVKLRKRSKFDNIRPLTAHQPMSQAALVRTVEGEWVLAASTSRARAERWKIVVSSDNSKVSITRTNLGSDVKSLNLWPVGTFGGELTHRSFDESLRFTYREYDYTLEVSGYDTLNISRSVSKAYRHVLGENAIFARNIRLHRPVTTAN